MEIKKVSNYYINIMDPNPPNPAPVDNDIVIKPPCPREFEIICVVHWDVSMYAKRQLYKLIQQHLDLTEPIHS